MLTAPPFPISRLSFSSPGGALSNHSKLHQALSNHCNLHHWALSNAQLVTRNVTLPKSDTRGGIEARDRITTAIAIARFLRSLNVLVNSVCQNPNNFYLYYCLHISQSEKVHRDSSNPPSTVTANGTSGTDPEMHWHPVPLVHSHCIGMYVVFAQGTWLIQTMT